MIAEPAENILVVYAYGVKSIHYGPGGCSSDIIHGRELDETGAWRNYKCLVTYQTEYLHYWVDDKLQYGEELRPTAEVPRLNFVSGGYKVDLRGPSDYIISG